MREAQQETMTQHKTMTQTACFRRPAAETPADLGQVTGERLFRAEHRILFTA